jgi:hypothetical protein
VGVFPADVAPETPASGEVTGSLARRIDGMDLEGGAAAPPWNGRRHSRVRSLRELGIGEKEPKRARSGDGTAASSRDTGATTSGACAATGTIGAWPLWFPNRILGHFVLFFWLGALFRFLWFPFVTCFRVPW